MPPRWLQWSRPLRGEVGVLTGWGGLYMLELIPAGICGLMPGLGLADLLNRIFWLAKEGDTDQAFHFFEKITPLLFFSLQHLELYHYCEKRLLQARGWLERRPLPGGRLPAGRLYPGAFRAPPAAGAANVGGGRSWEKWRVKSEEWRVESGQPRVSGTSKHLMN